MERTYAGLLWGLNVATTLTTNLKLRVDSGLTANAKYNLERIDVVGGSIAIDPLSNLNLRAKADITIEPNSAEVGGSGVLGNINLGTASHTIAAVNVFALNTKFSGKISLRDQSLTGYYTSFEYDSQLAATDDHTVSIDIQDANRQFTLGGDLILSAGFSLVGGFSAQLQATAPVSVVLPPANAQLATLLLAEELRNKVLDGDYNTFQNIDYASLDLTNAIVNADISPSAGILRAKLASGAADYVVVNDPSGVMSQTQFLTIAQGGTGANTQATGLNNLLPAQAGNAGKVLTSNGTVATWQASTAGASIDWADTDGSTFTFTHNLGTTNILCNIWDETGQFILVDTMIIQDANNLYLVSNTPPPPASAWRIVVMAVI